LTKFNDSGTNERARGKKTFYRRATARLLKLDPIIKPEFAMVSSVFRSWFTIINIEIKTFKLIFTKKLSAKICPFRDTEALVKNYQESLKPSTGKTKATRLKSLMLKKHFTNYFGKGRCKVAGNGKGKSQFHFTQKKTSTESSN
jgi:ParB family chromosome partitioning protein